MYHRAEGPRFMSAKFTSSCPVCGAAINKGDQICYESRQATCMADACGAQRKRDIEAADFDERQYASQF